MDAQTTEQGEASPRGIDRSYNNFWLSSTGRQYLVWISESPARHPFPSDGDDSAASNTASPTSHPILQIQNPMSRLQAKPGQKSRCQQRRVSASGTIDLDEIPRPEILHSGRIQWDHSPTDVLCSFLRGIITSRAESSTETPSLLRIERSSYSRCRTPTKEPGKDAMRTSQYG